ncbi:MAG TPA: TolC family protein [Steroidobacteraceae bacterium]|nr:TolC family protein [Steroidobacteraceae bacterium]
MRHAPLLLIMLAALDLGGCTGFTQDGGFDAVANATRTHLGQEVKWPRSAQARAEVDARVTALLAHPLSVEDAVQIALLNNHTLQAAFEELGISEAELVQAGRLPNPRFDLRRAGAAGQYDIEETLSFNVLALLTMPYAHDIEKRRFAQTQNLSVQRVAQLAKDTREAFYAAIGARQSLNYLQQVRTAAETGAELAHRMVSAGNWNRLDQAREQSFYSDAVQNLTRARLAEESARERLLGLLGLPAQPSAPPAAQPALQLADVLPELPTSLEPLPDVERSVLQQRLDLQLMRMHVDELSKSLGLTKSTRFVNVLDIGATRVRQGSREEPYERGYTVTLEVPIFDSGAARVKKSEAIYAQAVDRFSQAAIEARSQIRAAYAGYRAAFELAQRQRDEVLPLRQAIAQQNLLRYNASLISIFELLSDAREQAISVDGYIQSVRDFWIAKSRLDGALLGNSAS